ncbi:MAG: carboxypeptidase regulatory-like domain-containing protein [Verrucomicrobiales bacterium]
MRIFIVLLLMLTTKTQAFVTYVDVAGGTTNVLRWDLSGFAYPASVVNPTTKKIRYYIASDAYTAANAAAEQNAVRASFAVWGAVPGSRLDFEDMGIIPAPVEIKYDGTNVVYWIKSGTMVAGGTVNISGLRGYTSVFYFADNIIREADIVLNGSQNEWFTDINNTSQAQFIEGPLLHEIGHFLGLDHTPIGGATIIPGGSGVSTEAGLSQDEIAAARYLYPDATFSGGTIKGKVTMNGSGILGAAVYAEDAAGNIVSATVSRSNGNYEMPALPPGSYKVRVCPLDPSSSTSGSFLIKGRDIAVDYNNAVTAFHSTANVGTTLAAGETKTLDFAVAPGNPPFRIGSISKAGTTPDDVNIQRFAVMLKPQGQTVYLSVNSSSFPLSGASLSITGDGLEVGPTVIKPNRFNGGIHTLTAPVLVRANATPGLRSFVVTHGNNVAYANGYLELLPPVRDWNFDGLDDIFQRQYFPIWTSPQAAPSSDPDADMFSNAREQQSGTNPLDPNSYSFLIESVSRTAVGTSVRWRSEPGKKYQLYSRPAFGPGATWQAIGGVITASSDMGSYLDRTGAAPVKFYRLQILP